MVPRSDCAAAGIPRNQAEESNDSYNDEDGRGSRCVMRCRKRSWTEPGTAALMVQFVAHRVQQSWQAKGLPEGPPCSEEFRKIQDVLFSSCA